MKPRVLLASAWTLVILILCWIPDILLREAHQVTRPLFVISIDKIVHLGIFLVFAVLWMRASTSPRKARGVLASGLALAAISELGQMMPIVHRDAGLDDALADAIGVIIGIAAYSLAAGSRARVARMDPELP